MANIVISVENLSKSYRLGQIGTGTFSNDLKLWWAKLRGKPNPLLKIGETDHGNVNGELVWALKDVSFTVQQGEVLGIIGRNGAGKSTLLKILSRVTAPTSGQVKVKGRIASLLEVGTGFHPELTGRENIYLNGAILGMNRREIDRKFDEIVAFAEVEKFIDTPVKRYSSGMYVRLAFAVAAHLEPEILLVDEVLAVGDAEFQKKCLGKMGDVAKEGRTVLFVSHNLTSIRNICQNGFLILKGEIDYYGNIGDVIKRYISLNSDLPHSLPWFVSSEQYQRSGSGEAKIIWAKLMNSSNEGSSCFYMNEEFSIIMKISNPNHVNLSYAVEILDQYDYPLVHFWSGFGNIEKIVSRKTPFEIATIVIPKLNLYPDIYNINLWIGSNTKRIDKLEKCLKFQIIKDRSISQDLLVNRGRIYAEAYWKIISDS